jgi:hypothetical protein
VRLRYDAHYLHKKERINVAHSLNHVAAAAECILEADSRRHPVFNCISESTSSICVQVHAPSPCSCHTHVPQGVFNALHCEQAGSGPSSSLMFLSQQHVHHKQRLLQYHVPSNMSFNVLRFHAGWQWLFIIEGVPSVLLGGAILTWLPSTPLTAWMLSAEERELLHRKVCCSWSNSILLIWGSRHASARWSAQHTTHCMDAQRRRAGAPAQKGVLQLMQAP